MRNWGWIAIIAALLANAAEAADYKTLRSLTAPPPARSPSIAPELKTRPVEFVKAVVEPKNGEAWALAYYSIAIEDPDSPLPRLGLLNWNAGRIQADTSGFARIFDEELKAAGFSTAAGGSLFAEGASNADLKVGVLIDDMKGRFCADCPNIFNPKGIPATVVMTANWEVYSSLDRKVVAKVTTSGGADYKGPLGSTLPPIYAAFRDNVRRLLADDAFRAVVTTSIGGPVVAEPATRPALTAISFTPPSAATPVGLATKAVAVVFAADGSGSGFLISSEGYVLTNQHVVGGSKYVKLKWSNGEEGLGEVVRVDARRDVALIKTSSAGRSALSVRGGGVQQGEGVFAIGSPLGETLQNTMTKGIVSATRTDHGLAFIQSDVAITHGNSGGPLLDEKGQVIGIAESVIEPAGSPIGLNFFIPIDDALQALGLTPAPEPERKAVEPAKKTSGPARRAAAH